jgi:glycosyltransferase involved in cell wall biosynthesis
MAERIRVAFAIDTMDAGGTELNAVRVAERLDRARFDLRVVCMRPDGPLAARYAAAGIPVAAFPIRSLYGASAVRQGLRLARFVRSNRIAILHAHDIYSNAFAVPWGRLAGAKTIASRRWWEGFQTPAWQVTSRLSYRVAHAVLANSENIARRLIDVERVASERVTVVPNFLDDHAFQRPGPDEFAALRREFCLESAAPIIGIVANLLPVKDHATLLRAAAILRPRWPRLRVVLVGDGPCRPALEPLARQLGIADAVVFAGRRPSLPNLQHLFDVSVLCSISEGLPNSILEAMAAARPVVATRVGAVADAVREGETGLLVSAGDESQLAAAIDALSADSVYAARMGSKGAARARTRYSASAALTALESLYGRLVPSISLGNRPTGPVGHRLEQAGEAEDNVRRPAASRAS